MITIHIDGQTFALPEVVAAKDELLKAALAPFVPWIANAQIERKEKDGAMVVSVIKRADWKGYTLCVSEVEGNARAVINALIASPEEVNPAITLWRKLQAEMDVNDPARPVDPGLLIELEPLIGEALTAGEQQVAAVQQALARLVECAPTAATRLPLGF